MIVYVNYQAYYPNVQQDIYYSHDQEAKEMVKAVLKSQLLSGLLPELQVVSTSCHRC